MQLRPGCNTSLFNSTHHSHCTSGQEVKHASSNCSCRENLGRITRHLAETLELTSYCFQNWYEIVNEHKWSQPQHYISSERHNSHSIQKPNAWLQLRLQVKMNLRASPPFLVVHVMKPSLKLCSRTQWKSYWKLRLRCMAKLCQEACTKTAHSICDTIYFLAFISIKFTQMLQEFSEVIDFHIWDWTYNVFSDTHTTHPVSGCLWPCIPSC